MSKLLQYFSQDAMAADSWSSKYQMKDHNNNPLEETPKDMHWRLAKEFARVEYSYAVKERKVGYLQLANLSVFGQRLAEKRLDQTEADIIHEVFEYFDGFKQIVPQGSIMSNLGNSFVFGSLSNCFVIASPEDSYGGIMRADEELVQLMKRRGGVGTTLNNLRPTNAAVTNAAKTSSGVPSFAERYSNSTREVAQEGRRGALMLLLAVQHPDIFRFVTMKEDRSKVTGANVSVMFTDEFMQKVEKDEDFICRFPIDYEIDEKDELQNWKSVEYNKLTLIDDGVYVMKIKAVELFEEFVTMAHSNAEPGAAYIDRIQNYAPDGVYERFRPTKCNPCGEIWMGDYDACRLIAQNFFAAVRNPFTKEADLDLDKLYEISYMQQRYSDALIDLEVEYIQRIIDKLESDPQPYETKTVEIELWKKIQSTTRDGRRTGNGFTGLGDMLAALGIKYNGEYYCTETITKVMKTKMRAELDCTIDMAILRGTFEGWNPTLEFISTSVPFPAPTRGFKIVITGANDFYQMLIDEFPEQARRMYKYGRRNVSWSTVAPTGTVSLMTQTTSGLEPLFKAYYIRRKKINPSEPNVRVDFTDENGDTWQEYPVLHPKFKDWIQINSKRLLAIEGEIDFDLLDKNAIQHFFENSPWFGSEADDIHWLSRININAIIQKYTSNALSCTINLPKDVSKTTVHGIYMEAWKQGLKGVTIYRDGSRSGVLVTETKLTNCDEFGYTDAIPRPKELDADYHHVTSNGKRYAIFVGKVNGNPYELFAFEDPIKHEDVVGKIVKVGKGVYSFISSNYTVKNLQLSSDHADEKVLTRWVSLLLRHGANPKYIAEQVEKSDVGVVSFPKAVARILKTYIHDECAVGETCSNCGEATVRYTEGCKSCTSCGHSKC